MPKIFLAVIAVLSLVACDKKPKETDINDCGIRAKKMFGDLNAVVVSLENQKQLSKKKTSVFGSKFISYSFSGTLVVTPKENVKTDTVVQMGLGTEVFVIETEKSIKSKRPNENLEGKIQTPKDKIKFPVSFLLEGNLEDDPISWNCTY